MKVNSEYHQTAPVRCFIGSVAESASHEIEAIGGPAYWFAQTGNASDPEVGTIEN